LEVVVLLLFNTVQPGALIGCGPQYSIVCNENIISMEIRAIVTRSTLPSSLSRRLAIGLSLLILPWLPMSVLAADWFVDQTAESGVEFSHFYGGTGEFYFP